MPHRCAGVHRYFRCGHSTAAIDYAVSVENDAPGGVSSILLAQFAIPFSTNPSLARLEILLTLEVLGVGPERNAIGIPAVIIDAKTPNVLK